MREEVYENVELRVFLLGNRRLVYFDQGKVLINRFFFLIVLLFVNSVMFWNTFLVYRVKGKFKVILQQLFVWRLKLFVRMGREVTDIVI